jgi:hypothetical protein
VRLGLGCGRRAPSELSQPQPVGRLATGRVLIGALVGGLNFVPKNHRVCLCVPNYPSGTNCLLMMTNIHYMVF